MKKLSFILVVLLACGFAAQAQTLRKVKNDAFQRGELLVFRVYYDALLTGEVNAGIASLEVTNDNKIISDRSTYRIIGKGRSIGAFNFFFKVVDRFETIFDEEALAPWIFVRRSNEGGYKIEQDVTFNQFKNFGKTDNKPIVSLPEYTQDMISAFYYARTLDFSDKKAGDIIDIPFFLDDTLYTSRIVYEGKEVVKTSMGKFNCLKFKPMVAIGTVFDNPYPMILYVTDDKNRIPVMVESGIIVGTVKMELIQFKGLKNDLTALIK